MWAKLKYHEKQSKAWRTKARFVALAAGRGSGKTELARRRIVRFLKVKKPWVNPMYFYALPTYKQAKRVAWRPIVDLIPPEWIDKKNDSSMYIKTIFGSELYVVGMDDPERIEGSQWDGCVVDEACDHKPRSFELSILPALTHRGGWAWRIGVPKRVGIGAASFKTFCHEGAEEFYSWPSSDILAPEDLAYAKSVMDDRDFNEQFDAKWENATGAIFYSFDEDLNVSPVAGYNSETTIIVGSDFTVDPMCWVLMHQVGQELHVFDEIFIRNTNTQATLTYLYEKYREHKSGWLFIGDATSRARKTSAVSSDYMQINGDERFEPKRVLYPRSNPAVVDRFSCCNAMLRAKNGHRRLLIHPRCKRLITDLTLRAYKENSRIPNDKGDIGHITDALGYPIYVLNPIGFERRGKSGVITNQPAGTY